MIYSVTATYLDTISGCDTFSLTTLVRAKSARQAELKIENTSEICYRNSARAKAVSNDDENDCN